jgi:hypothetical protein
VFILFVSVFDKINKKWVVKYVNLREVEKTGISEELMKEFYLKIFYTYLFFLIDL